MRKTDQLSTYWFSFPKNPDLPIGIGVTAFSQDDARLLISERGLDKWCECAREIDVRMDITIADLDQSNVVPNIGPLQFRGVWFPASNIGIGAPTDAVYSSVSQMEVRFEVWRLDDNDNEFLIRSFKNEAEALDYRNEMTARGHKQTYWVRRNDA